MASQPQSRVAQPAPASWQMPPPAPANDDAPTHPWRPEANQQMLPAQPTPAFIEPPPAPNVPTSAAPPPVVLAPPVQEPRSSLSQLLDDVQAGHKGKSPNSFWAPGHTTPPLLRRVTGLHARDERKRLIAEYISLQDAIRQLCTVWVIISIHNSKSGGKSTLAAWLTAHLQQDTGNSWVLVDCNENAGGPARRSGVPTSGTIYLQDIIGQVNDAELPLEITHEWANDNLSSHWQPSVGVNEWGIQRQGEGFKVVICNPMTTESIRKTDYMPVGRKLKSAFGGMVQDTGNGLGNQLNEGAFEIGNVPIFTGRLDNDESMEFLGQTLLRMRMLDQAKADSGLIVVNATTQGDFAEQIAYRFCYDPARVLFIPHHDYLVNGRNNQNGNVVRLDKVSLEVLVAQKRVALYALQVAKANGRSAMPKPVNHEAFQPRHIAS